MGWITGAAIYFIVWWLVLFMVLPWGIRSIGANDVAKGHASSAPQRPRIFLKMAVTTVIALLIWAAIYFVIVSGTVSFRD